MFSLDKAIFSYWRNTNSPRMFCVLMNVDSKIQMKMSPNKAAQGRHIDRIRWIEHGNPCNIAKREKCNSCVTCEGNSTLDHTADRPRQTKFQQIIHKVKLTAAQALHLTNTKVSNQTNAMHKSLACLVCDCFILTTS